MNNDKLQHHGIKGQRWGVRRYQNKDGSLTPLGRQRQGSSSGSSSSSAKKASSTSAKGKSSSTQKKVSEMSDDELRRAINRKRLEQEYAQLNPKKVTKGQKFANTLVHKVVEPALIDAGKEILKSEIKKAYTSSRK